MRKRIGVSDPIVTCRSFPNCRTITTATLASVMMMVTMTITTATPATVVMMVTMTMTMNNNYCNSLCLATLVMMVTMATRL